MLLTSRINLVIYGFTHKRYVTPMWLLEKLLFSYNRMSLVCVNVCLRRELIIPSLGVDFSNL